MSDLTAQGLKRRGSWSTSRFEVKHFNPGVSSMREKRNVQGNGSP